MYKISLLPVEYKQAITQDRKKNDVLISFIFTITILSMLSLLAVVVNTSVKNDLAAVQSENNALISEIGALSIYRDMQTEVSTVAGNIQLLTGEAPSFPKILSEMAVSVPDSIQIMKIIFKYNPQTKTSLFEVGGNAAYYDDVSAWINKLNNTENIGEVLCSYTTDNTVNSTSRVQFELKMDILDKSAFDDIAWK